MISILFLIPFFRRLFVLSSLVVNHGGRAQRNGLSGRDVPERAPGTAPEIVEEHIFLAGLFHWPSLYKARFI